MDIQIIIKEYMKENKVSFREFAKMCGLPNSTLQSICERGILSASYQNASKIAGVLGVSLGDFQSGDKFSRREQQLIMNFKKLDERGKSAVEAILESQLVFAKQEQTEKKNVMQFQSANKADYISISKKQTTRTLKVFLQPAAAGLGNYLDDDAYEEMQFESVPSSADFGVRISGDSMQPQICDGDIVFVKKQETLEVGEIGIYVIEGDAFCKKLIQKEEGFFLHSLNSKYNDFPLPAEAFLVGKVVLK